MSAQLARFQSPTSGAGSPAMSSAQPKPPDHRRRVLGWRRRRDPTTFEKCLALHMYFAAPHNTRG